MAALASRQGLFDISVVFKGYSHSYSYEAPVQTFGNVVSGGGTRASSYSTSGYQIRVKNNSMSDLEFRFEFTLFKNIEKRIVERKSSERLHKVRPGYTELIDIDLGIQPKLQNFFLEDLVITEVGTRKIVHSAMELTPLFGVAQKNITPMQRLMGKIMGFGVPIAFVALVVFIWRQNSKDSADSISRPSANTAILSASASLQSRIQGTWRCVDTEGGPPSEPVTIRGTVMLQKGVSVGLYMNTSLDMAQSHPHPKKRPGVASYLSPNGNGVELSPQADGTLKMKTLLHNKVTGEFQSQPYSCTKTSD